MKIAGIFQTLVGAAMIGIWLMNFFSGGIPEFQTEPYSIAAHILAEMVTALLLLISGFSILIKKQKKQAIYYLAFGALLYTLIASPGYFAQLGDWGAVLLFTAMLVLTVFFLVRKNMHPILLLPLVFSFASCKNKSYLEQRQNLTILHLEGTAYDRGQAHGLLLKDEIHSTIASWKQEVENEFELAFDTVLERFLRQTDFEEDMAHSAPGLLDEVRGISASSGIPFKTMLAFQLSEEMFTLLDREARLHCTSMGIANTDSTPCLLAQNMDPPPFLHGHPMVMHIIPPGNKPEAYIFTVPGLLGMTGLNDRGVGICCMSISMLNHANKGVPVVELVRTSLEQFDLENARSYLENASYAIPQCYTLGSPEGVACFECSTNEIAEFYPFEENNIILHTNFSINNHDFSPTFTDLLRMYGRTIDDPYFCPRYFHAYDKIEEYGRELNVQNIKRTLRLQEPELKSILNENTLGTLVMKLSKNPELHLAIGNSGDAAFHKLTFE